MSNPTVARTAPIAIAPKPAAGSAAAQISRSATAAAFRQHSFSNINQYRQNSVPNSFKPAVPCYACQQSRTQCIMSDDDDSCIPCQATGEECSLVSSPQPRKRKLNGDSSDDAVGNNKRRQVGSFSFDTRPYAPVLARAYCTTPSLPEPHRSLYAEMIPPRTHPNF